MCDDAGPYTLPALFLPGNGGSHEMVRHAAIHVLPLAEGLRMHTVPECTSSSKQGATKSASIVRFSVCPVLGCQPLSGQHKGSLEHDTGRVHRDAAFTVLSHQR